MNLLPPKNKDYSCHYYFDVLNTPPWGIVLFPVDMCTILHSWETNCYVIIPLLRGRKIRKIRIFSSKYCSLLEYTTKLGDYNMISVPKYVRNRHPKSQAPQKQSSDEYNNKKRINLSCIIRGKQSTPPKTVNIRTGTMNQTMSIKKTFIII